jgi:hypothetical protein
MFDARAKQQAEELIKCSHELDRGREDSEIWVILEHENLRETRGLAEILNKEAQERNLRILFIRRPAESTLVGTREGVVIWIWEPGTHGRAITLLWDEALELALTRSGEKRVAFVAATDLLSRDLPNKEQLLVSAAPADSVSGAAGISGFSRTEPSARGWQRPSAVSGQPSQEAAEEIVHIVQQATVAVGAAFDLPRPLIDLALERLQVKVHVQRAQSLFDDGIIHLCVDGTIDTLEAAWRLQRSAISEVAHHYINVFVRPSLGKGRDSYAGVEEAYEAAARSIIGEAAGSIGGKKIMDEVTSFGALGEYFLAALLGDSMAPEWFFGGYDSESRRVLAQVAADMVRARRSMTRDDLRLGLSTIFNDFWHIVPGCDFLLSQGATHLVGYATALELNLRVGAWPETGAVMGLALQGDAEAFLSYEAFMRRMGLLTDNPVIPARRSQKLLMNALAKIKGRFSTIEVNPIRFPVASPEVLEASRRLWQYRNAFVEKVVGILVDLYRPPPGRTDLAGTGQAIPFVTTSQAAAVGAASMVVEAVHGRFRARPSPVKLDGAA